MKSDAPRCFWTFLPLTTAVLLASFLGCSGRPSRIVPPKIVAGAAASRAMETYDKNSDGFIADDELDAAASLKASMKTLDTDGDGKVSSQEIEARIGVWQQTRVGIASILCYVRLDGRPLEGATVTFRPEPFLGDHIQMASGKTNFNGVASPVIPKEDREEGMPPGIQLGLFQVTVSKEVNGKEKIPARYNVETTLGQQVANDDPAMLNHKVILDLKSR